MLINMNFWLLTGKDVLKEKYLLEKKLNIQTSFAEKQYQGIGKLFKPKEIVEPVEIKEEKPEISESKIVCDNKYNFSDYKNVRKYSDLSLESKYYKLLSFYHRLNEFRSLVPHKKEECVQKCS